MLSLLRDIRRSLLNSGSSRKYLLYALGEFILIVAGILVAMQINNWNENRQQNKLYEKEHQETLLAIYQDLKLDVTSIENVIYRLDDQYHSGLNTLSRNRNNRIDSSDARAITMEVNTMIMNINVDRA